MRLDFYCPHLCTKEHVPRSGVEQSATIDSIIYVWSQPEQLLVDKIMHEVLLGASYLKRRTTHMPFHSTIHKNVIRVAIRVANVANVQTHKLPHTKRQSFRWQLWITTLKHVLYKMKRLHIEDVCVGYV